MPDILIYRYIYIYIYVYVYRERERGRLCSEMATEPMNFRDPKSGVCFASKSLASFISQVTTKQNMHITGHTVPNIARKPLQARDEAQDPFSPLGVSGLSRDAKMATVSFGFPEKNREKGGRWERFPLGFPLQPGEKRRKKTVASNKRATPIMGDFESQAKDPLNGKLDQKDRPGVTLVFRLFPSGPGDSLFQRVSTPKLRASSP